MQQEKTSRRPALGRGLGALIPSAAVRASEAEPPRAQVIQVAIEQIHRDEQQPRRFFDRAKLDELAASIREKGIIQPILVRRAGTDPGYRIIAGERRWRAAQLAGLKEVPAILKEASEHEAFELALVENLQRQDLNPVEEAEGYRRLLDEHGLTQENVARRVGKDRSTVANALRLLQLPPDIKESLVDGSLNMGHARALLGVSSPLQMKQAAAEVIRNKLSVRATERLVRKLKLDPVLNVKAGLTESIQIRSLTERFQRAMGTRCRIHDRGGMGHVELEFSSYEDLERMINRILPEAGR